MARHGPHHSAQKSTSTGWLALSTSTSKLLSVNVWRCSDAMRIFSAPSDETLAGPECRSLLGPSVHFDIFPGGRLPRVVRCHSLFHQRHPHGLVVKEPHRLTNRPHERVGGLLA